MRSNNPSPRNDSSKQATNSALSETPFFFAATSSESSRRYVRPAPPLGNQHYRLYSFSGAGREYEPTEQSAGACAGCIPAKLLVMVRAMVTAALAKLVDAVNQYAEAM